MAPLSDPQLRYHLASIGHRVDRACFRRTGAPEPEVTGATREAAVAPPARRAALLLCMTMSTRTESTGMDVPREKPIPIDYAPPVPLKDRPWYQAASVVLYVVFVYMIISGVIGIIQLISLFP
jgi:hypothetical protein